MAKKKMNAFDWVAISLLIVGGVNWGLVGLFNYNLVETFASSMASIIYSLVGFAAVFSVFRLFVK